MKILYIGDIVAKIGRRAVAQVLPKLKEDRQIDFVIAQAENMSTGNGITKKALKEMQDAGYRLEREFGFLDRQLFLVYSRP